MPPSRPEKSSADVCTTRAKPSGKAKTVIVYKGQSVGCTEASRQIPIPQLPARDATKLDFWLAAWSRETAKLETLVAYNNLQATRKSCDKNGRLFFALIDSKTQPRHAADLALNELHFQGGAAC